MSRTVFRCTCALTFCAVFVSSAAAGPTLNPQPTGTAMTTVSYLNEVGGQSSYSEALNFHGPGASVADVNNIGNSPNIGGFIAYNTLGRRTDAIAADPSVQHANETLMRHGFYKAGADDSVNPTSKANDFFSGIDADGNITITIENITFDRPVTVREDTFLLHALWDLDQVDLLDFGNVGAPRAYNTPHNQHLVSNFRDFDSFFLGGNAPFDDNPANYVENAITPVVSYDAPNIIDISLTVPYRIFTHLEDDGLGIPNGVSLPAPGGFLEPFHLHLEYLVAPEPGSLALLLSGVALIGRRRH
jgi:hypothetical protein